MCDPETTSVTKMCILLVSAGFEILPAELLHAPFKFSTTEETVSYFFDGGNPLIEVLKKTVPTSEHLKLVRSQFLEVLQELYPDPSIIGDEAIVVVGRKIKKNNWKKRLPDTHHL